MEKDLKQLITEMDAIEADNDDFLHPTAAIDNPKQDPELAKIEAKADQVLKVAQQISDLFIKKTQSTRG